MMNVKSESPGGPKARTRSCWTAEERVDWVNIFERSGKTVAKFCRDNGLADATLSLWRRQLRGPSPEEREAGGFIEVALPAGKEFELA
jgi:transposase-like protein